MKEERCLSVMLLSATWIKCFKLIAAFWSLLCSLPHLGHSHVLSDIVKSLLTYPHILHVFEEANHLSASITIFPCSSALVFNRWTKVYQPKSYTDFPWLDLSLLSFLSFHFLNFAMSFIDKDSMTMTSVSLTNLVEVFSMKSLRLLAMCSWSLANLNLSFFFNDLFFVVEILFWSQAIFFSAIL